MKHEPRITEIVYPTQFRSSYHKASVNLAYTSFWVSTRQRAYLKSYDLTWEQFSVLSILREHYPYAITQWKIGSRIPYILINPRRAIQNLKERGLVEYNTKTSGKKERGYIINKEGLRLLTRIDRRISKLDKIIGGISPETAEALSTILDKIRNPELDL